MDNLEFETRAFADPEDSRQDLLDALSGNPDRQQLLEEVRAFNERLSRIAGSITPPSHLAERLRSVAAELHEEPTGTVHRLPARRWQPMRLTAMAAALVVALGLTYSSLFGSNQPSAAELAFGQQVVNHIYLELAEIEASGSVSLQQVNQAVSRLGGSMANSQEMGISFARPCAILPQTNSAHLVIDGRLGAVNVIIIENSPVRREFNFSDERFEAVVMPLERGNLILVGEKNERLEDYQRVLDESLVWSI